MATSPRVPSATLVFGARATHARRVPRASYRLRWQLADGSVLETDGYEPLNLLAHAEVFDIQIVQACGGQAECGTCRVRCLEGTLTPPTADERELRQQHRKRFEDDERLACQCRPRSDLLLSLPGRRHDDLRERS